MMTNEKKQDYNNTLIQLSNEPNIGTKLRYWVARNINVLKPYISAIDAARDGSKLDGAKEYHEELKALQRKIVGKENDEKALLAFEKKVEALKKKHEPFLDKLKVLEEELKELMQQEDDIKLFQLKFELFPEEQKVNLTPIIDLIEEPKEK